MTIKFDGEDSLTKDLLDAVRVIADFLTEHGLAVAEVTQLGTLSFLSPRTGCPPFTITPIGQGLLKMHKGWMSPFAEKSEHAREQP
jgi:hypothetical protein